MLSFPPPGDLPDLGIKPWTPALQADALPSEPPGNEHWSGLLFPSPGDLHNPGIRPMSHVPPALTGGFFIAEPPEQLRISMLKVKVKSLSRVRLFATPWTVGYQAPPSMGFSRQESWSGLPFPSPGDLPDPGIEPPALQADTLPSKPPGKPQYVEYLLNVFFPLYLSTSPWRQPKRVIRL